MDKRSDIQKRLDSIIGPPLYYSDVCKLSVGVKVDKGGSVSITRPCGDCDCPVIAPRKVIAAGEGGLNFKDKAKVTFAQVAAALTGRCV